MRLVLFLLATLSLAVALVAGPWASPAKAVDGQVIELSELSPHYHQANLVVLDIVTLDPEPAEGDLIVWERLWPGLETWEEIPFQHELRYQVRAEQALDGVQLRAKLVYADEGSEPAVSEPRTIHVDDHGGSPIQFLTVGGSSTAEPGGNATLYAYLNPFGVATELKTYLWERKRVGEDEFTPVEGVTGNELRLQGLPEQDHDSQYRVSLVTPAGVVGYGPSEPLTLTVLPRLRMTSEPEITGTFEVGHTLTVEGLAWNVEPDEVTIQWLGTGVSPNPMGPDLTLPPSAAGRSVSIQVDATKEGYAPSSSWRSRPYYVLPLVANEELPSVSGTPTVGETLTASPGAWTPEPDEVAFRWLAAGEPIDGATGDTLDLTEAHVGKGISVRVTASSADHTSGVAESAQTAAVAPVDPGPRPDPDPDPDPQPEPNPQPQPQPAPTPGGGATGGETPVATTVTVASVRQVYGRPTRLVVTVSPQATGEVSARIGNRTIRGVLAGGRATLTLPARALRPGRRTVQVTYAGADGRFAPSGAQARVQVVKAQPRVRVRPVSGAVLRGGTARFAVTVAGVGVTPTGRVTVRVAGTSRTVALNRRGTAVVRVGIRRGLRPGSTPVAVSYRGDALVAAGQAGSTRIRVL